MLSNFTVSTFSSHPLDFQDSRLLRAAKTVRKYVSAKEYQMIKIKSNSVKNLQ